MLCVLRARDSAGEIQRCAASSRSTNFDDARVAKMTRLLDEFGARPTPTRFHSRWRWWSTRLRTSWQLIRLATKPATSKAAADVARAPYAIAVSMVLDHLDDKRLALHDALKRKQIILIAKDILTDIYAVEFALRVRIDQLDQSAWGERLNRPDRRDRRSGRSGGEPASRECRRTCWDRAACAAIRPLAGRLTYLAWKGRDALAGGAAFCRKLVSPA